MTGTDIDKRMDKLLNDPDKERWDVAARLLAINDGIVFVRSMRPESILDAAGDVRATSTIGALTDTIPLVDKWMNPVTDYACWRCYMQQAGETENRHRATMHEKNAIEMVSIL